ncbi:MAG: tRNA (guanine-N(7)-)-methyltransferase [Chlamydiae bacterium]|nr:tRNA (guanine-N(7)-)-methyltransferase [Chlamydiota bacterium]
MTPKDLLSPFKDKKQKVFFDKSQNILYIPQRTERVLLENPLQNLFSTPNPIHLEFCSGNGDWICQKAELYPQWNWIALEMRFDRVRKIWSKMKNRGLNNLLICCGEALDIATHYVDTQTIDQISINFPDPWPKKRHAKHRLIQAPFLNELSRVLKPGGVAHVVTDDENYFQQISRHFLDHSSFSSLFPNPYFTSDVSDYGGSYFMNLWKEKKRSFYFSKFQMCVHS